MTSTIVPGARALGTALVILLGTVGGCATRRPDDRLAGVPISAELRPAVEASRRSLDSGDGGAAEVRRDLDRFHGLTAMLEHADRRLAASDSLHALWRADLASVLWPELSAFRRNLLVEVRRFDALFDRPDYPDTSSALGAYLREWKRSEGRPDGSGYARAWAARSELSPWQVVWLTLRMSRYERQLGHADSAARLALGALPKARRLGGWRLELEAWLQATRALKYGDHLDDALHAAVMAEDLARAVTRQTGNPYLMVLARLERAEVLGARRESGPALELYRSCADSAMAHGLPALASECLNLGGSFTAGIGDREAGLAFHRRSLAVALADRDSLNVPRILANIARRHLVLGHLDSCRADLSEAERWIAAYPDRENRARFPLIQAEYHAQLGDFDRVDSLHAVAARLQPGFSPIDALAELHLQVIQQGIEGGRTLQAYRSIAFLDSVRDRLGTSVGDRNERFDLELASAEFLRRQGLFGRAGEALERAAAALERRPDPDRQWEYTRAIGDLAESRGDLVTAEQAFRSCLTRAVERHDLDREARSRLWLASTLLLAGRYDSVSGLFPSEHEAAFGGRHRTRLSGLLIRAMAESRRGRFAAAISTLDRARALGRPGSPPDLLARLDLEHGRALAGLGRFEEARRAYRRVKVHLAGAPSLGDGVRVDHDLRRELAERMLSLAVPDTSGLLRDRAAAARALDEVEDLLPAWQHNTGRARTPWVEPQLVYFVGSEASFRWTIAAGRITLHRLPGERELLAALAPVLADLQHAGREPVPAEVAALASALGGSVSGWPKQSTLTIVPDGPLFSIPWPAMPAVARDERDWIDRGPIVLAQTPVVQDDHVAPARPGSLRLLALGVDGSPGLRGTGSRSLRHAEREAREVHALWPTDRAALRIGPAAQREVFTTGMLSDYDVIHVSSHATVYQGFAERTSLLLAGAGDAPLTAADIGRLALHAELVYLSCCEAGEGVRRGTGPAHAGLVRCFLAAGARCVIAPSTRIEDEAARRFAVRFHAHWLRGASIEAALRQAQLDARGADPRRAHPSDWAFYQVNVGHE